MKYISDLSFRKGRLVIKVKSAVVRNELSFQKSEILKKINEKIEEGIVKEIILK